MWPQSSVLEVEVALGDVIEFYITLIYLPSLEGITLAGVIYCAKIN